MRFIKRLMEIKEEQLGYETAKLSALMAIEARLIDILYELKGRLKDGKDKNRRN